MRVIVCGSRNWSDYSVIETRLRQLSRQTTIVHGGSGKSDNFASRVAADLGFKIEVHYADWKSKGRAAGVIRNAEMAQKGADLCIAFWDGMSRGTANMIDLANKNRIPLEVILEK